MNNPNRKALEVVNTRPASALLVTAEDQMRMIKIGEVMAASGFFPGVKDAAQAAVKIMAGAELGLTPIQSVNGIDIIQVKDRPPRMRPNAEVTKVLLSRKGYSWQVIEHTDAKCTLRFFKDGESLSPDVSYSVEDARRAGLVKDYGAWKSWPKNMTFARCITQGAKFLAPDIFDGAPMEVVTPQEVETEPLNQDTRAAMMIAAREKGLTDEQRHELSKGESWSEDGPLTNADGVAILAEIDGRTIDVGTGEVVDPKLYTPADPETEPVTDAEWDQAGVIRDTGVGGTGKVIEPKSYQQQTVEQEALTEYRETSTGFVCEATGPNGERCLRATEHSKGHAWQRAKKEGAA